MKIVIAGASGFVGVALAALLRTAGHQVFSLVRRPATDSSEIQWDPSSGKISSSQLTGTDAVINLAGENVGAGRWTQARRERILRSRVDSTRTLVAAMAQLSRKPTVFLNASAVGAYGDRGDEILTERSEFGPGFLPEVCLAWETHAEGAARLGIRTVLLRFGVILGPNGGALARMLPIFRMGLGGRLGSGRQWFSWIALVDAVAAIENAVMDVRYRGPINFVAPNAVTNREFTATLSRVLHRPAVLPVPGWALRLAFGSMADEALLASTRVTPERLLELGYSYRYPSLQGALESAMEPGKV